MYLQEARCERCRDKKRLFAKNGVKCHEAAVKHKKRLPVDESFL